MSARTSTSPGPNQRERQLKYSIGALDVFMRHWLITTYVTSHIIYSCLHEPLPPTVSKNEDSGGISNNNPTASNNSHPPIQTSNHSLPTLQTHTAAHKTSTPVPSTDEVATTQYKNKVHFRFTNRSDSKTSWANFSRQTAPVPTMLHVPD